MPHQVKTLQDNAFDASGCPPNCPYRLWYESFEDDDQGVQSRQDALLWQSTSHEARHVINKLSGVHTAVANSSNEDAAYTFMVSCGLEPTPDAIGQLTEAFLPCLRIMCDPEHPWDPNGGTWRKGGIMSVLTDAKKKWERFWERTWTHGQRHDDSGLDLINFVGFVMRSKPDSRWGSWGEPK